MSARHFKVHRDADGTWAECLELDGCRTQADTDAELRSNAAEALNVYLDEPADSDVRLPLPREVLDEDTIEVAPDPGLALSVDYVLQD